jgi:hypothetical protein
MGCVVTSTYGRKCTRISLKFLSPKTHPALSSSLNKHSYFSPANLYQAPKASGSSGMPMLEFQVDAFHEHFGESGHCHFLRRGGHPIRWISLIHRLFPES